MRPSIDAPAHVEGVALQPLDALGLDEGAQCAVTGAGRLAIVRLRPTR